MKLINVKRKLVIENWKAQRAGDNISSWIGQGWQTEKMIQRTIDKRSKKIQVPHS